MFIKRISTKQPFFGLSSSPSSVELRVLHSRFTYVMKETDVTKGRKEIQKNYEKLLPLILLHFMVSHKLQACSCLMGFTLSNDKNSSSSSLEEGFQEQVSSSLDDSFGVCCLRALEWWHPFFSYNFVFNCFRYLDCIEYHVRPGHT